MNYMKVIFLYVAMYIGMPKVNQLGHIDGYVCDFLVKILSLSFSYQETPTLPISSCQTLTFSL